MHIFTNFQVIPVDPQTKTLIDSILNVLLPILYADDNSKKGAINNINAGIEKINSKDKALNEKYQNLSETEISIFI